eukprot:2619536-Rhodomonas_salina.1
MVRAWENASRGPGGESAHARVHLQADSQRSVAVCDIRSDCQLETPGPRHRDCILSSGCVLSWPCGADL